MKVVVLPAPISDEERARRLTRLVEILIRMADAERAKRKAG